MGWKEDNQVWNLDSPYGNSLSSAYDQLAQHQSSLGSNDRPGLVKRLNDLGDQFKQRFQVSMGRAPKPEEMQQFFNTKAAPIIMESPLGRSETDTTNVGNKISTYIGNLSRDAGGNPSGLSTPATPVNQATATSDISQYIPPTSQQQQDIINNAIGQSQGVANQNVQSLQDIMGPYVQSQVKNWTDPNSPDYQSTIGSLNNVGRADAGTFSQSLSSRLAPLIGQNMMSLGTNALAPSFQNQQNLVGQGAGTQSSLGLASLQRFIDQQNFQQQAALANQLADKGQPSNFQQGIGGASSILGGLGNLGQGIPGFKDATSYVCLELIKRNLLCESDMDNFHVHIMPAFLKKGRAFWKYAMDGKKLVDAVNLYGENASFIWRAMKPLLFDEVMKEPDACLAVDRYASACHVLSQISDPSLWDSRVKRTGILDSLIFLPRLFLYKPFLEMFLKCLRVKMALVYDKPRCRAHYGI